MPFRLPRSRILRDVLTTYSGFVANAALSFVALTVMAKQMEPGSFGLAALANMFMAVVAGLAEPGIGTSLVRLTSRPGMTREAVEELIVAAIRLKLVVLAAVMGLTYFLIPWIAAEFWNRPEITALLRCCLIGAALLTLADFAGCLFQLRGTFRNNAMAIAVASAVRAAAILGLGWSGRLNLETAVASMILMNGVQCGVCVIALRGLLPALPWRCRSGPHLRELVAYAKCLVIWLVAGTVLSRADMMMLPQYVSDNNILGFYSAAAHLCLMVPQLTRSINMVLLPRISAINGPGEMIRALRNCGLGALAVLALLAPVAFLAGPLLHLIYGARYAPAVPIFRILFVAVTVELALNPLSTFWHALNRPGMLSVLNLARLSLVLSVAAIAIPRMGAVGAAFAVFVAQVIPLSAQGIFLWILMAGKSAGSRAHHRGGGPGQSDAPIAVTSERSTDGSDLQPISRS